jgi:hypothetical protein
MIKAGQALAIREMSFIDDSAPFQGGRRPAAAGHYSRWLARTQERYGDYLSALLPMGLTECPRLFSPLGRVLRLLSLRDFASDALQLELEVAASIDPPLDLCAEVFLDGNQSRINALCRRSGSRRTLDASPKHGRRFGCGGRSSRRIAVLAARRPLLARRFRARERKQQSGESNGVARHGMETRTPSRQRGDTTAKVANAERCSRNQ